MAVLLGKNYGGYLAGTTAQFPTPVESALIAQGYATTGNINNVALNAVTANVMQGTIAFAAGTNNCAITNNLVDVNSVISAQLITLDGTLFSVVVLPANGSFSIRGNTTATGVTLCRWMVLVGAGGLLTNNSPV